MAEAIKSLEPKLIQRAFLHTGISIRPDGSQDDLIRIKGINTTDIDWNGWEKAEGLEGVESYKEVPISIIENHDEYIVE